MASLPLFFLNYQQINSIPFTDRAFYYGDGVFETIAVVNNHLELFFAHWHRLSRGCKALQILPPSRLQVELAIQRILTKYPQKKAILKIIVSRGDSMQGYAPDKTAKVRVFFALYSWPKTIEYYASKGIAMYLCRTRLVVDHCLSGIKHLNRLEQVMASIEFKSDVYQEGLMCDRTDRVIEGTKTNIFIYHQNQLKTPALTNCGIKGVMRALILDVANSLAIPTIECELNAQILQQAEEVFVCNSLIKIWPVTSIMSNKYVIGSITQMLQQTLQERIE